MNSAGLSPNFWDPFVSACFPNDRQCSANVNGTLSAKLNWNVSHWSKVWNESVVDVSAMISRLGLDHGNNTFTENVVRTIVEVQ